jgi:riboflavin synthase
MFTGLVQALGRLESRQDAERDVRFVIGVPQGFLAGIARGASIAVNGVCLTATVLHDDRFEADVSAATLAATTLGGLEPGAPLNLEHSLTPASALGGHLVSGHVDGVGRLVSRTPDGESWRMVFEMPPGLSRYVARKGSTCVDGISLTVNAVDGDRFEVNIVPHTLTATNLDALAVGGVVNLEVDLIARYLERLMEARA